MKSNLAENQFPEVSEYTTPDNGFRVIFPKADGWYEMGHDGILHKIVRNHNDSENRDDAGNHTEIKPVNNSTSSFKFTDKDGNVILTVDSTNKKIILNTCEISNDLHVNGDFTIDGTITSEDLKGTTDRMVEASPAGLVSSSKEIITGYITDISTKNALSLATNWNANGIYTGPVLTNCYQGQNHFDNNYLYTFVADNTPIRLIRG